MANKKSQGYEDALQSIYDLIFTQKKTKPPKFPPKRYSALDPQKEMLEALGDLAAYPTTVVSNAMFDTIGDTFGGLELSKYYISKTNADDEAGRVRVRTGDIGKWLSNPDKYIDSVYDAVKKARKGARIAGVGRGVQSAMTWAWAAKHLKSTDPNASLQDIWDFGLTAGQWTSPYIQARAKRKILETSVMKTLRSTSGSADARRVLDLLKLSKKTVYEKGGKKRISELLRQARIANPDTVADTIMRQYLSDFDSSYSGIWISDSKGVMQDTLLNRMGYSKIWRENLFEQVKNLDTTDPNFDQKRLTLLNMVGATYGYDDILGDGGVVKGGIAMQKEIDRMRDLVNQVSGSRDPRVRALFGPEMRRIMNRMVSEQKSMDRRMSTVSYLRSFGNQYRHNSKDIRKALQTQLDFKIKDYEYHLYKAVARGAPLQTVSVIQDKIDFYKMERKAVDGMPMDTRILAVTDFLTNWNEFNRLFVKGELAKSVLDGSFFASGSTFSPARLLADDKAIMYRLYQKGVNATGGPDYEIGRFNNFVAPRADVSPAIAELASLYYLTPRSILKTLFFNGEGFAYIGYRNRRRLGNFLSRPAISALVRNDPALYQKLMGMGAINQYKGLIDPDVVAIKFHDILSLLKQHRGVFGGSLPMSVLQSYERVEKTISSVLAVFNYPVRTIGKIGKFLDEKLGPKALRQWLANGLMKAFPALNKTLMKSFVERSVGLYQVIRGIIVSIFESVGITTSGPLGGIVAALAASFVTDALFALSKPFLKILNAIVWALSIGGIAILIIMFMSVQGMWKAYDSFTPGSAVAGSDNNLLYGGPFDYFDGVYENAPVGNTCPIYGSSSCSQGAIGDVSTYHKVYKAMDISTLGVWYAPDVGTVVRAERTSNDCTPAGLNRGGTVVFKDEKGTVYHIYHVAPLVPAGTKVGKGVAVARAQGSGEVPLYNLSACSGGPCNPCWTGPHLHLHTYFNGQIVDTIHWYRTVLKCTFGGSNCLSSVQ